jgi:hypothetical protein
MQVPRLTIKREAQRIGDQYIVPEGTSDWYTWWEILRSEWFHKDSDVSKFFDERYIPLPTGLPMTDSRSLPPTLKTALGAHDPKVDNLVWTPSENKEHPFTFLKPILRFNPITAKTESILTPGELDEIKAAGNVQILYMPNGTMDTTAIRKKQMGAIDAIIIAVIDGVVGWVSQRGAYGIKIPIQALPESLDSFRLI